MLHADTSEFVAKCFLVVQTCLQLHLVLQILRHEEFEEGCKATCNG